MFVTKKKYDALKEERDVRDKIIEGLHSDARRAECRIMDMQASNRRWKSRVNLWEQSGLKLPKVNMIDTPEKKKACIGHIQKYLDRIAYLKGNEGENAKQTPQAGPIKGQCICSAFDYDGSDTHNGCRKCPLGPEFQACMKTPDYMTEFNVRFDRKIKGRHQESTYPSIAKLTRRMHLLRKQFKEAGLDVGLKTPKTEAVEMVAFNIESYIGKLNMRPGHLIYRDPPLHYGVDVGCDPAFFTGRGRV